MMAAQKYPGDFNGILAGSPALNWTEFAIAELWPQVVMYEAGYYPSPNEFEAITQLTTEACDGLDGVKDGVISNLKRCDFDPSGAVGQTLTVNGDRITVTDKLATVARLIWEGPKTASGAPLWAGLNRGASFSGLAGTVNTTGVWAGAPFLVPQPWIQYFLKKDPSYDVSKITSAGLRDLFTDSTAEYGGLIDSADPDLSAFNTAGGKLLTWHGESDQLVFPQDSVAYRRAVESRLGGRKKAHVDDFFRLFLAPGVDHCNAGTTIGAGPSDPFGALRAWVEKGEAPDELAAASAQGGFTRKLCKWPLVAKYDGHHDPEVSHEF